jgi:hypothetical protein
MAMPFQEFRWERWGEASVATSLKAVQPILDVTGPPADFASTDAARAGKVSTASATVERRARFEAGDVEHVSDG